MIFLNENIYQTAIDYAKTQKSHEIFDILSKVPIKASESWKDEIKWMQILNNVPHWFKRLKSKINFLFNC